MDFENRSEVEAALLRGDLPGDGQTQAIVVAKACGAFDAQGRMALDFGIKVPVCFRPEPHPFGEVPANLEIVKQGLDVIALGKAYHPRVAEGAESRVTARVGRDERQLAIFGERFWYQSADGHWRISEPQAFSLQELTWEHSFGGTSFDAYGNDSVHPLNKDGKGFIASEEAIADTALPNVEDPVHLIASWHRGTQTGRRRHFSDSPSAQLTEAEAKAWWKDYKLENKYELLAGGLSGESVACHGDSGSSPAPPQSAAHGLSSAAACGPCSACSASPSLAAVCARKRRKGARRTATVVPSGSAQEPEPQAMIPIKALLSNENTPPPRSNEQT